MAQQLVDIEGIKFLFCLLPKPMFTYLRLGPMTLISYWIPNSMPANSQAPLSFVVWGSMTFVVSVTTLEHQQAQRWLLIYFLSTFKYQWFRMIRGELCHCDGCWCPESLRWQFIGSHGIDNIVYMYTHVCIPWGTISTTRAILVSQDERKRKYTLCF